MQVVSKIVKIENNHAPTVEYFEKMFTKLNLTLPVVTLVGFGVLNESLIIFSFLHLGNFVRYSSSPSS